MNGFSFKIRRKKTYNHFEAKRFDDEQQVLVRGLDAALHRHIAVMVQQRAQIDPITAWLQNAARVTKKGQ